MPTGFILLKYYSMKYLLMFLNFSSFTFNLQCYGNMNNNYNRFAQYVSLHIKWYRYIIENIRRVNKFIGAKLILYKFRPNIARI